MFTQIIIKTSGYPDGNGNHLFNSCSQGCDGSKTFAAPVQITEVGIKPFRGFGVEKSIRLKKTFAAEKACPIQ